MFDTFVYIHLFILYVFFGKMSIQVLHSFFFLIFILFLKFT